MEVNPNTGTSAAQSVTAKPLVTPPVKAVAADSASFRQADAVNSALQQTPDVRADAIAKARTLVSDPSFPPLSMVNAISKLIATKLNQDPPEE
jgi:hypothetical protein